MKNSQIQRMKEKEVVEMWLIIRKEQRKLESRKTRRKQRTKKQVRFNFLVSGF